MIEAIPFAPADRVLLLSAADSAPVAAVAPLVPEGAVVVLCGDPETLRATRRTALGFDNVMAIPGSPGQIPWRDSWFQVVIEPGGEEPISARTGAEVLRVLEPGGWFWMMRPDGASLEGEFACPGMERHPAPSPWERYQRPGPSPRRGRPKEPETEGV